MRLNPQLEKVHNNLGLSLVEAGRPREAIEHYQQALRLKPDFTEVYYNLALAYAKMHQSSDAIASAQKALDLARSQAETTLAGQIEDWLNAYRAELSKQ